MPNPNLELLELAADRLRQLLPEIVFVGGCATGLLIDDPAAAPVRGTYDVDVRRSTATNVRRDNLDVPDARHGYPPGAQRPGGT